MTVETWLKNLDEKCAVTINAIKDIYTHMDKLEEIPGVTEEQMEEVFTVAVVKMTRMQNTIENLGGDLLEKDSMLVQ